MEKFDVIVIPNLLYVSISPPVWKVLGYFFPTVQYAEVDMGIFLISILLGIQPLISGNFCP